MKLSAVTESETNLTKTTMTTKITMIASPLITPATREALEETGEVVPSAINQLIDRSNYLV